MKRVSLLLGIAAICGALVWFPASPALAGPAGAAPDVERVLWVAVDKAGNVYMSNGLGLVRRITSEGVMSVYAGVGAYGFKGDGGPAVSAEIIAEGIAVDPEGNLFIAGGGAVRKVTPAGIISTVAGTGQAGFSGDGGPAKSAQITAHSVALDPSGNLYIAGDFAVRKVTTAGVISTVVGTGVAARGFEGDGQPATAARINQQLRGIAIGSDGAVFIADSTIHRVRRKAPADGVIRTVAGNSTRSLGPAGSVAGPTARFYFLGGFGGDGGPGTSAELQSPYGIAVDAAGNLYIADSGNNRVRKLTSGGIITTVAGNGMRGLTGDGGPATSAAIGSPFSVALDGNGNLFIASGQQLRKVTRDGVISTVWSLQAGVNKGGATRIPPAPFKTASFAGLCALVIVITFSTLCLRRGTKS
jgi:hypothetical protein